ncbi:MAG: helix-turn-helix domain-containing protein [Chloroflexi bacterium]|nr:helix-turn-helix domain-containing protein [Chloroflexota bacterium]
MPQDDRPTLTTTQVMDLLGVSRSTVVRLVQRGELKAYKLTLGQTSPLRIYKDSVDELLDSRQQQPSK